MPSTSERLKAAQARHRHQNFTQIIDYLHEHPCTDCGETDAVVLDFDHLPGEEKRFEIARAINASTRSWASISAEISKCEVVCANCHRRRTARRAGHRKHRVSMGLDLPAPTTHRIQRHPCPMGAEPRVDETVDATHAGSSGMPLRALRTTARRGRNRSRRFEHGPHEIIGILKVDPQ